MSVRLEGVAWACVVTLGVGVVYEVLVATRVVSIGSVPGEGAPGAGVVLVASLIALLVGAGVSLARSRSARRPRSAAWSALPVAGAVYVVAHWTSFDPYYAPTRRRYSQGGVAEPWVLFVVLAAALVAAIASFAPRLGAVLGALVLVVEALTVFVMPFGK